MEDRTSEHKFVFAAAMVFVTFFVFCVFLLLKGRNKTFLPHQMAAVTMLVHIFCCIIHESADLHWGGLKKEMPEGFCWLYLFMREFYIWFIPTGLFMISIERLMFIKNQSHKVSKACVIVMFLLPFLIGIIVAAIYCALAEGVTLTSEPEAGEISPWCDIVTDHDTYVRPQKYAKVALDLVLPLACMLAALGLCCCPGCKCSERKKYNVSDSSSPEIFTVKQSALLVIFLNILYIVVNIMRYVVSKYYHEGIHQLDQSTVVSIYGMIQAICFIALYNEVKYELVTTCCFCCVEKLPDEEENDAGQE